MSQTFDFYDARANEAKAEADAATLDNVRERNMRAAKTWRTLADQAKRVMIDRAKADLEREQRRAEELAATAAQQAEPPSSVN